MLSAAVSRAGLCAVTHALCYSAAMRKTCTISIPTWYPDDYAEQLGVLAERLGFASRSEWAHSRFPGHALTPTGVMAIRCKQFHLPDL